MDQNYFLFQGNYYPGSEGLSMENPLSPFSTEIFMTHLEAIVAKLSGLKLCQYWFKYVDDIVVNFTGAERQLDKFLDSLNKQHKNIKSSVEIEQNYSLNFLDLTISEQNNKDSFAIYHKPSHTDIRIHSTSYHPNT